MPDNRQQLGALGEQLATDFLEQKGYKIIKRNFRCKAGEIDIIAHQHECLVIVEVKTRQNNKYGSPAESVNLHKQRKICRATRYYLQQFYHEDCDIRFDVIAIFISKEKATTIEHIPNAFEYFD